MSITAEAPAHGVGNQSKMSGFRFRLALPVGQLALCALILWPLRGMIRFELGLPMGMGGAPWVFQTGPGRLFLDWSLSSGRQTVAAINLPGGALQLPIALLTRGHQIWKPPGIEFQTWNALTWPVLGLVFWWIAGRGIDALLAARRKISLPSIRWTETVVGFILGAGGLVGAFAFLLTGGQDRYDPQLQLLASGMGMWGLLGSLIVAARIVQWRIRKAESNARAL